MSSSTALRFADLGILPKRMLAPLDGYEDLPVVSLEEAVERAILRTGQFAVRQERWFRRDPRINWISGEALALSTSEGKNRSMNDTSTASQSVDEVERMVNLVL